MSAAQALAFGFFLGVAAMLILGFAVMWRADQRRGES